MFLLAEEARVLYVYDTAGMEDSAPRLRLDGTLGASLGPTVYEGQPSTKVNHSSLGGECLQGDEQIHVNSRGRSKYLRCKGARISVSLLRGCETKLRGVPSASNELEAVDSGASQERPSSHWVATRKISVHGVRGSGQAASFRNSKPSSSKGRRSRSMTGDSSIYPFSSPFRK